MTKRTKITLVSIRHAGYNGVKKSTNTVVDNLENQFIGKQIDIETYYSKRNAAMIQLAAIESRLKCQKKELNNL